MTVVTLFQCTVYWSVSSDCAINFDWNFCDTVTYLFSCVLGKGIIALNLDEFANIEDLFSSAWVPKCIKALEISSIIYEPKNYFLPSESLIAITGKLDSNTVWLMRSVRSIHRALVPESWRRLDVLHRNQTSRVESHIRNVFQMHPPDLISIRTSRDLSGWWTHFLRGKDAVEVVTILSQYVLAGKYPVPSLLLLITSTSNLPDYLSYRSAPERAHIEIVHLTHHCPIWNAFQRK